ncbi:MAG: histidinol dehydrogenase [Mogibacterium sp.]|nr:histidinol dehydrogenase [Mogibacterium sp.]
MIRIMKFGDMTADDVFARTEPAVDVEGVVADIIDDVIKNGDEALKRYTAKFDGADLDRTGIELSEADKKAALDKAAAEMPGLPSILKKAAANIVKFHSKQVRNGFLINDTEGVVTGQKVLPLERAGLYVPGGTAAYPSTVLMDSIPALIAGCKEIIMVTPPDADGSINAAIVAAAAAASAAAGPSDMSRGSTGRIRIFRVGGAQAIAALAYGTAVIPKVDKIVGPGNAFVAEAKRQVYGKVAIDMIAGPSEILVIADGNSDPVKLAADLLSQAEHDKMARAVMVTYSENLALAVQTEIERQLPLLEREEIARASIENNGKIIIAGSIDEAIDISNEIAPEHLELCVDDPFGILDKVKHAGSVFMGRNCPEALGDYFAGPNHTLPTSGTARFSSPLSVDDFVKKMQYTYYTGDAVSRVADDIAAFARVEGLTGHAASILTRKEQK